jgi:hypothetical protein
MQTSEDQGSTVQSRTRTIHTLAEIALGRSPLSAEVQKSTVQSAGDQESTIQSAEDQESTIQSAEDQESTIQTGDLCGIAS